MTTAFLFAPAGEHTLAHHPEGYERVAGLLPFLAHYQALEGVLQIQPQPASPAQMTRVHTHAHLQRVRTLARLGGGRIDPDTYVTPQSYELGLLAAGGCVAMTNAILGGRAGNGLAVVRPPGHHASADRAEGFCLFNNVAIAARHAQEVYGVERILIVDFDVHHGNGTQRVFYEDDCVLFVSLHLYSRFFYPGLGDTQELGLGSGRGYTLNVPFPAGVGDHGYRQAFELLVRPKAVQFQPQLILVSVGFDAHWRDPLAAAGLSLTGYDFIVRYLLQLAADCCGGKIMFVLEGGYYREALHYGLLNLLNALTGREGCLDPLGPMPAPEQDVTNLLNRLAALHLRK